MSKAVIYIDIEDDITSIIDRVKASQGDIVALVPPKRIGVLQSIVNLKLLKRAAAGVKKRVVLITNDQALMSLAGGVKIPTAKNLQSRPEVAPISALEVDNEDVINGEELSVGEMDDALTGKKAPVGTPTTTIPENAIPKASPVSIGAIPKKEGKAKGGLKVPDFMKFRKKLLIIGGASLALILLLWWALWIAPHATITIQAKTEIANIDRSLALDPSLNQSEPEEGSIKPLTQQLKKNNSVEFEATGKKEVGEKAKGKLTLINSGESKSITVPAGSRFTASDQNVRFTSDSTVVVPGAGVSGGQIVPGVTSVNVTAVTIGPEYNIGAQSAVSNDVAVDARFDSSTSGGSKKQITVVSDGDVEKARAEVEKKDDDAAKKELEAKFSKDYRVIEESFRVDTGDPSVSPAVGAEASTATLTVETTYAIMAVHSNDLDKLLDVAMNDEIGDDEDKSIYDNGRSDIKISEYQNLTEGRATMRVKTTGYIGAKVNEEQLKEDMVGKRYGEIESLLKEIPNVERVDIKFSPFWVSSAPPAEKIELKFNVSKNDQD